MDAIVKLGEDVGRAWKQLAEGWRELRSRASQALTRFVRADSDGRSRRSAASFPRWSLLAGELADEGKSLVVTLEVPGVAKPDLDVRVVGQMLIVRGERRAERESIGRSYYLRERAYGSFQRIIPLPQEVDSAKARCTLENGVLSVTLPKRSAGRGPKLLTIH